MSAQAPRRRTRRFLFKRRKYCKFCETKVDPIDYKDIRTLQNYIPERAKILPRRVSGTFDGKPAAGLTWTWETIAVDEPLPAELFAAKK